MSSADELLSHTSSDEAQWRLVRSAPTRQVNRIDGLAAWIAPYPEVAVVSDPAIVSSEAATAVRRELAWAGCAVTEIALPHSAGAEDLQRVLTLTEQLATADAVVALGGGSVIDPVKLAISAGANPFLPEWLARINRVGYAFLSEDLRPARQPLVAIPTTLGTGTEVSRAACVVLSGGRRLVVNPVLAPTVAVHDARATAGLPAHLVLEGVLEILTRVCGLFIGQQRPHPFEDGFLLTVAERVMALGAQVVASGDDATPDARQELAQLSAASHSLIAVQQLDPFGNKGWYLGNEVSTVLGVRKMIGLATITPAWWSAIQDGRREWGSPERLAALWHRLAPVAAVADEPVRGIAEVIDGWGVRRRTLTPEQCARATEAVCFAWGYGLPPLAGITRSSIESVIAFTSNSYD